MTRAGGSAPAPAASASASATATTPVSPLVDGARIEGTEGLGKNVLENEAVKDSRSGRSADPELEQVNALYLLLEDRFKKRVGERLLFSALALCRFPRRSRSLVIYQVSLAP